MTSEIHYTPNPIKPYIKGKREITEHQVIQANKLKLKIKGERDGKY